MHTEIFLSDGMQILPCLGESLHVITAICFHLLGALANLTDDMRAAPQLKGYKSCLLAINDGALVAEVPDWMRLILSPALLPMRVCAFLQGAWICQCSACGDVESRRHLVPTKECIRPAQFPVGQQFGCRSCFAGKALSDVLYSLKHGLRLR